MKIMDTEDIALRLYYATEMAMLAAGGTTTHSLYKGALTDPDEAKRFKTIMIAAAEFAALRLKDVPSSGHKTNHRDPVFSLIDKNDDGKISIEELTEVMEELGGRGEDATEMMQLFDSNSDGSLSSDEFHLFQKQVPQVTACMEIIRLFLYRKFTARISTQRKSSNGISATALLHSKIWVSAQAIN